jgi:hypothetical protein
MTRILLTWVWTFGAFAGMAQTLTCTFQFNASGTIGTQNFTNAAVTITTVGYTSNRQAGTYGGYQIDNNTASAEIAGVGNFRFNTPPPTSVFTNPANPAPGVTASEFFALGSIGSLLLSGTLMTSNFWTMLGSIGPVSLQTGTISWSTLGTVATTGGSLMLYDTGYSYIPVTFQAVLTGNSAPNLTRVGVLSHIAAGGGWTTVITLINSSSTSLPVTVQFYNDSGTALSLPVTITDLGTTQSRTTSSVGGTINPNASLLITTGQLTSTVDGWADILSTASLSGYAIFRSTPATGSPSEGTVPLQSQYPSTIALPYDNTNGFVMGVALANLSTSEVSVTATMWDANGNQIGIQTITIAGSGHTSFVLPNQFPATVGLLGIMQFQSNASGGIAGLGLRFSPFGTFTSVPTM